MDEHTTRVKKDLRRQFRQVRKTMTAEEAKEKSVRIAGRIAGIPEYRNATTVLIYRAADGEADLQTLAEHPASSGKRFAYPVCVSRTEMKAMIPGGWRQGKFNIPEPDPECSESVAPEEIDLAICPGVAFDSRNTRLGMGGGFYDRFLPECVNALVIMAAFETQRANRLPREETDIAMDRIVTEEAVYMEED